MPHVYTSRFLKDIAYTESQFAEAFNYILTAKVDFTISGTEITIQNFGVSAGGYFLIGVGSESINITQTGYIIIEYQRNVANNTEVFSTVFFSTFVPADTSVVKYGVLGKADYNDSSRIAFSKYVNGVSNDYKKFVSSLEQLELTAPVSMVQLHNALPIGGSFENIIPPNELTSNQFPEIIYTDNSFLTFEMKRLTSNVSLVRISQIFEEGLTFTTTVQPLTWDKYYWKHVAGTRTILANTSIPDGGIVAIGNQKNWLECVLEITAGATNRYQRANATPDRTNLAIFDGYVEAGAHSTNGGVIPEWNNNNNAVIVLNQLAHLYSQGAHNGPFGSFLNSIVGTVYKEERP